MRGIGEAFIANDIDPDSVAKFIEGQQQT